MDFCMLNPNLMPKSAKTVKEPIYSHYSPESPIIVFCAFSVRGQIYVRKEKGKEAVRVLSRNDIEKIINQKHVNSKVSLCNNKIFRLF